MSDEDISSAKESILIKIEMSNYNFNIHKHRFSVWTSARAVQRGFTTTAIIKKAIEQSELREFAENPLDITNNFFEEFHKRCSSLLINAFASLGIKDVSYGRAAKIISIYLKTSIIIGSNGESNKSKIIHPPIDNILLTSIANNHPELKSLKKERWTTLTELEYWSLVFKIKEHFLKFDWSIEEYWSPENEESLPILT